MKNKTYDLGFGRAAGILMPVSSLPSPYGIGNMGRGAYEFIDLLDRCAQRVWQVLPLNPTSYGDSPYQSPASAAGNPYFIDPEALCAKGLLTKSELKAAKSKYEGVDYGWLFTTRYELLRLAHSRFVPDAGYRAFLRRESDWVEDYALFMALKVKNSYMSWCAWDADERDYATAKKNAAKYDTECRFWLWVQYEFASEWNALLDYAHSKKIKIIGDMPIYVAHDSMDVWRSPEEFLLDENYAPRVVAGCPPDAYAEDGQLWGNPIYDWEHMKENGFAWWCARVGRAFRLYDILRIDHFRGFASFYSIPYGDENARRGEWVSAPGKELFDRIKEVYPKSRIIAEDLGFITDDVRELLAYTGFPGMKLLQFAFFEENNEYLPRTYTTDNCIVYTASHDSDCTRSWAGALEGATRARFLRECKRGAGESATAALIRLAMESRGKLAIIPIQDYLELTNERGRMNTPSTDRGNWCFRVPKNYITEKLVAKISTVTKKSKRAKK